VITNILANAGRSGVRISKSFVSWSLESHRVVAIALLFNFIPCSEEILMNIIFRFQFFEPLAFFHFCTVSEFVERSWIVATRGEGWHGTFSAIWGAESFFMVLATLRRQLSATKRPYYSLKPAFAFLLPVIFLRKSLQNPQMQLGPA
jgi:hypothetical protein